jgi:hypothetical protein
MPPAVGRGRLGGRGAAARREHARHHVHRGRDVRERALLGVDDVRGLARVRDLQDGSRAAGVGEQEF